MKPNTVPAAGEAMPKDEKDTDAIWELDAHIDGLAHMANIAADLFSEYFPPTPAGPDGYTFKVTVNEYKQFDFAMNDVAGRATRLKKAFAAAMKGEACE